MNVKPRYNQFQLFVLAFLATEEKKQEESGQAFGRPNPNNLPIGHRYVTTISELSLKLPPSSIPDEPTGREMLSRIEAQIDELKHDALLENDSQFSYDRQSQDQGLQQRAEYMFENTIMD
jgi:hypothetical protein